MRFIPSHTYRHFTLSILSLLYHRHRPHSCIQMWSLTFTHTGRCTPQQTPTFAHILTVILQKQGSCQLSCCGQEITGCSNQRTPLNPAHEAPNGSLPQVADEKVQLTSHLQQAMLEVLVLDLEGAFDTGFCTLNVHERCTSPWLDKQIKLFLLSLSRNNLCFPFQVKVRCICQGIIRSILALRRKDRKNATKVLKRYDQSRVRSVNENVGMRRLGWMHYCITSQLSAHTQRETVAISLNYSLQLLLSVRFLPLLYALGQQSAHPALLKGLSCVQMVRGSMERLLSPTRTASNCCC